MGLNIQINELMKFNEHQRSKSLFDLGQRSLRFQNSIFFFSEAIESFRTKFHMKAYGNMERKIYTNDVRPSIISNDFSSKLLGRL